MEDLRARIQNRSFKFSPNGKNPENELTVDLKSKKVFLGKVSLSLTHQDVSILLLLKNKGLIVTRDMAKQELKGGNWNYLDRSVDNSIVGIRRTLGCRAKNPKFIKAVCGEGYMFIGPVNLLNPVQGNLPHKGPFHKKTFTS